MTSDAEPQRPSNPRDVLSDDSMSTEEKITYLEEWQLELEELQRATEESMGADDGSSGRTADRLQDVHDTLTALREQTGAS